MSLSSLRSDIIAWITVALVLVPQSMAYAQLAWLPAYYWLYAALLPVIIASMWWSSNQLSTGPVAVVSLLTASALTPLALPWSSWFIIYAVLLTFLVWAWQIVLWLFRLWVVINFLSHPVIVWFTNAAAIIIWLSQLNKLIWVSLVQSEHFINDIIEVIRQVPETHLPTLAFWVWAFLIMWILKKYAPKIPWVLVAVALTTVISFSIWFERKELIKIENLPTIELQNLASSYLDTTKKLDFIEWEIISKINELKSLKKDNATQEAIIKKQYEIDLLKLDRDEMRKLATDYFKRVKQIWFTVAKWSNGEILVLKKGSVIPEWFTWDTHDWRIKKIEKWEAKLIWWGDVISSIPEWLPKFQIPNFDFDMLHSLLVTALIISLVWFMEAISITKAIATKTRDHIDPNQELIGQWIANIAWSFIQSFPTSWSFSRSAVNFNAWARTWFASVITWLVVLITLLFLTPYLYHLPQAVLAAVIMMAVIGLINFHEMKHLWDANKHDWIASIVTFIATLGFAPHLDNGILLGWVLALILYLIRISNTRIYACIPDVNDSHRKIVPQKNNPCCSAIQIIRVVWSLFFWSVAHAEKTLISLDTDQKFRLILAHNINFIDTAWAEFLVNEANRIKKLWWRLFICWIRPPVMEVLEKWEYIEEIGLENIFDSKETAIKTIIALVKKEVCNNCNTKIFLECK